MSNPPLPSTIGKKGCIKDINGNRFYFVVLDEVKHVSNDPNKVLYLQRIRFERNGEIVLRLGYYIIGQKPKMKGKWTWGSQHAPMMFTVDFKAIINQATKEGLI